MNAPDAVWREHYFRTLLWLIASSPLWIVGAVVSQEARLLWWALAAGLDLIGTWLAHLIPGRRLQLENAGVEEGGHMLQRCRLFLIIALGETVLTTGAAIAAAPTTLMSMVTGAVALAGTVALWALAFGGAGRLIIRHVVEETSDPVRATRHAGNALLVMVAGLIAVAVANEMVVAHPHGHASAALSLLLFGGLLLFLLALGWYLWVVPRVWPRLRVLVGSAALVSVGFAASTAPPYVALILAGATLVTLAILDGGAGPRGRSYGAVHDGRPAQSVQGDGTRKT